MNATAKPRVLLGSDPGPFAARCAKGHVIGVEYAFGPCPKCRPGKAVAVTLRHTDRPLAPEGQKLCRDCGETKPHEAFTRNPRLKDGVGTYCRPCASRRVVASQQRAKARKAAAA
jgi:hypothetical protein